MEDSRICSAWPPETLRVTLPTRPRAPPAHRERAEAVRPWTSGPTWCATVPRQSCIPAQGTLMRNQGEEPEEWPAAVAWPARAPLAALRPA